MEKRNLGNEKRHPNDPMTRNEWALHRSKANTGVIPSHVVDRKTGEVKGTFPSRRQAKRYSNIYTQVVNA